MGTWGKGNRFLGWLLVAGVLLMLVPLSAAAAPPSSAAASGPPRPGNHQAEQQYFERFRQAPKGATPSHARVAALQQAEKLPSLPSLPPTSRTGSAPAKNTLIPPTGTWQDLGPAPQDSDQANPGNDFRFGKVSGRATALAIGSHTGVIYLGTADGGVWKSTDTGITWTALTDRQPSLAIGALALDPTDINDSTLYAGTGETNYDILPTPVFNGDAYFGVGVLKTTDGGLTWTLQGQSVFGGGAYSANSIGFDVLNVNGASIFAGTTSGLFHSADGGLTWTPVIVNASNLTARVTDLAIDGTNVYAVLSEANAGHLYAGVYKSLTSGASGTFVPSSVGLPLATTWARARLAIAKSTPTTLYLSISDGSGNLLGMYKTTTGGAAWAVTGTQPPNYFNGGGGGQGFYDTDLVVDPANANNVYAGGVYRVASTDGGATWAIDADVYCSGAFPCRGPIHPDQHASAVNAAGTKLYVANDGGIWRSDNPTAGAATTWVDLNTNIETTQFYAGDAAANYSTTPIVAGGAQDNGTSRTASGSPGTWAAILGGDGGFVAIDKSNPNIVYAEYQNGALQKTTNANAGTGVTYTDLSGALSVAGCSPTQFIAPFTIDRNSTLHLAFGANTVVCETLDGGTTWHASNTNPLNALTNDSVQSVAIAPSNSAVIYAGTLGGQVYRTTAGNTATGSVWTNISAGLPTGPPTFPAATAISISGTDPDTAYVTFGNFGVPHVFKTINGGGTWTNITGNLPDIPTTSIVTYASSPNPVLVVGTDIGVYVSTDNGATWAKLDAAHLPNVGIQQLFTDKAQTTLFAATHGRGMWKISIPNVAVLVSIAVTPLTTTIPLNGTAQYTATGTYADSTTANLTASVTWASDTPAVATINAAGLATGVSLGTAKITATLGAIVSPPATLTVAGGVTAMTTLTSSANPSTVGQLVTFTATVTGSSGAPTGTVTFKEGATTLGTGTLSSGSATFATSTLTQGSHTITAVYGGDATYNTSTSAPLTQIVNAASLTATTTTLTSSVNPSTVGQSVTFTAAVAGTGGTPTGTVTFKEGATTLGTGTLSGGSATFATSTLSVGNHIITAVYDGDATFAASTSAPLTQVVNPVSPPPASGLQYYPLTTPVRLLDTRPGATAFVHPGKPLAPGQSLSLPGQFSYLGVTVPASAQALVGNATVDNSIGVPAAAAAGFATLHPDQSTPTTSNLNFLPGTVRANAFTTTLAADGTFTLFSSTGGNFIIDISGYYAPVGAGGLYFHPLAAPVRELDTRSGNTAFVHPNAPLTAGQTLSLPGSFTSNSITVPASAKALVGNVTVANDRNKTPAGFATLSPGGVALPLASNLNFVAGTVAPNAFTVGVGGDGTYSLYSSTGGDFVVDITGYLDTTAAGGLLYTPLSAPVRELDTRSGATAFVHPNATLTAGQTLTLPGSFTYTGITVPASAKTLVGNATVANDGNSTPAGFATLYPDGVPLPLASNLNFVPKQVAPNAITVGIGGDGKYALYSSSGGDFIIDITGFFS